MTRSICKLGLLALLPALGCGQATAAEAVANFTGPLLTPSASNLPAGTVVIEPYLIYNNSRAAYDDHGNRHAKPSGSSQWQTIVPFFVGITDRFQMQVTAGAVHSASAGSHSNGFGATDTTVAAQYMLLAPDRDGRDPAVSINYSHRFPTGAYDQLDENPLNATGNGASVDKLSLLIQQYIWLSNGRPLRWRAVAYYSLPPSRVSVNGASAYGTPKDFRGYARLGSAFGISTSIEYSFNPQWVFALDLAFDRASASQLKGVQGLIGTSTTFQNRSPSRSVYSVAPAVEYNFNDRFGIVAGVQFSVAGRNNDAFVAPQVAFNMVF